MQRAPIEIDIGASPAAAEPTACGNAAARLAASESSLAGLLLRTAECLTALLHAPTAQAGLNESRYNVMDSLRRKDSGCCSQTELATQLLLSESNLSTLLERMRQDGLISRVRSQSDRRVTLIALSSCGREALARADQSRARAAASILKVLDGPEQRALCDTLGRLVKRLERTLGIAGRSTAGAILSGPKQPAAGFLSPVYRPSAGGQSPAGVSAMTTEGATP